MAEHTPEPWECRSIGVHCYDLTNLPRTAKSGETEANARRIAAAVNACAGIPTEALESGVIREMRDALQLTVDHWSSQFERRGHSAPEWCRSARAALAKVGGSE